MGSDQLHKAVESELLEERAAALGRVTRKLEVALAALAAAEQALVAAPPDGPERDERRAARQRARREAERWLWCVQVQRESIGLYNHEALMRVYRVPRDLVPALRPA